MRFRQAAWKRTEDVLEPTVFELGTPGRGGTVIAKPDPEIVKVIGDVDGLVPKRMRRGKLNLPGMSEPQVARHFSRLAQMNYGVDSGPYWLGSCTMKYNPKAIMRISSNNRLRRLHPFVPIEAAQHILRIMYELQEMLSSITGLPHYSLQPAAGAQGELVGALMIRAKHLDEGENQRDEMIIPVSAHGSNFASAAMAGFKVIKIPTSDDGTLDIAALKSVVGERTAGIMITNPNTLGIFESEILEISDLIHSSGGYVYYDGANLNAILGWVKLSDMGVDVAHLNMHKTFAAPHGGGGPGAGAVGATDEFKDFLPIPLVKKSGDSFYLEYNVPKTVGKVRTFYGNPGVLIKSWAYLRMIGTEGLRKVSSIAVLNANYARKKLQDAGYKVPYGADRPCKHEFVLSLEDLKEYGVRALDVAKALIDRGVHPPTIYFPLIVKEAFMMEPTETDSLDDLDGYVEAMKEIRELALKNPELLRRAPENAAVKRLNEVLANRKPVLTWKMYQKVRKE